MSRLLVSAFALLVTFGVLVDAQQRSSEDAAQKAAAAEKAAQDEQTKRAAQEAQAAKQAEQARSEREFVEKRDRVVPLDIEIVISRSQGDKKISALPYALTVNASSPYTQLTSAPLTQLRMGGQVPLPTTAPALGPDGKPVAGFTGGGPVQYKEIGTFIDARGRWLDTQPATFEVWISVQEDAVATPQGASATALPVIRTFRAANNLVLKDGQARQFTAAADRITGETVKVDVSLKVAK